MNLSSEEKSEVENEVKKFFGTKIDIEKLGITPERVETGIMELLLKEKELHKSRFSEIWVRLFLIDGKKMLVGKKVKKLRLKTYWVENDELNQNPENRKLMSYTDLDLLMGGMLSRLFVDLIKNFAIQNPHIEIELNDISIYFQFDVSTGEPRLAINYVRGSNPMNVLEAIDLNQIF